jgi:hypothetical protein
MNASRLLAALIAVLAACSPVASPPSPVAGLSAGPDAGSGAGRDPGRDAEPPRTLTTRPLLGTSIQSLLLDPFVTSDRSWGHFVGLAISPESDKIQSFSPLRAFVSLSPAGVSSPVASLPPLDTFGAKAKSAIAIAPFPGGSDPFAAQIQVSAGDASDAPVDFETAAGALTVSLLPNDDAAQSFVLVRDGSPPRSLGGRQWVRLALAAPAPMPQGGWFSIAVTEAGFTFQVQAPEVTPTRADGPVSTPLARARHPHHRAALVGYLDAIRHDPPPEAP